jgi:hypothetical protein
VQFDVQKFQGGVMAIFTLKQTKLLTPQVTPQVGHLLAVIQDEMTRQQLMAMLGL